MIIGMMANTHVASAWKAFPVTMAIAASFNAEAGSSLRHGMMGTQPDMKEKLRLEMDKLRRTL